MPRLYALRLDSSLRLRGFSLNSVQKTDMPIPSREPFQIGSMKFQILDRRLMGQTTAHIPYGVISITGREQLHPCIPASACCLGVLRIKFDDIQENILGMTLFSEAHAHEIIDFYDEMRAKGARLMIINCEQGRCRSAAIGAALAEMERATSWFDKRFEPNVHVRRVMGDAVQAALISQYRRFAPTLPYS